MKDCVSLKIAKELQKVGWKDDTDFYYINNILVYKTDFGAYMKSGAAINNSTFSCAFKVPAPTATQLAEELPNINIMRYTGEYTVREVHPSTANKWFSVNNKSLPDALGLMMVYLLKNNLLKQ